MITAKDRRNRLMEKRSGQLAEAKMAFERSCHIAAALELLKGAQRLYLEALESPKATDADLLRTHRDVVMAVDCVHLAQGGLPRLH